MKLLMLQTRYGVEDGFTLRRYHKGKVYDVSGFLGHRFINKGWGKKHEE